MRRYLSVTAAIIIGSLGLTAHAEETGALTPAQRSGAAEPGANSEELRSSSVRVEKGFERTLRQIMRSWTAGSGKSIWGDNAIGGIPRFSATRREPGLDIEISVLMGRPEKVDSSKKGDLMKEYTMKHTYADGSKRVFTRSVVQVGEGVEVEHASFYHKAASKPGPRRAALVAPGASRYYVVTSAANSSDGKPHRIDVTQQYGRTRSR